MRWVLLLVLLAPAAFAREGNPYPVVRQTELWEFRPSRAVYTFRGCLEVARASREAVAPVVNPAFKGSKPLSVHVEGPWKLLFVDEQPYPGSSTWVYQAVVLEPSRAFRVGERVPLEVRLEMADAPILHRQGGDRRFLSLVHEPEVPGQSVLVAVPETPVEVSDAHPASVRRLEGWRVFRYEVTGRTVIHLGFALREPACPLPSLETLAPEEACR